MRVRMDSRIRGNGGPALPPKKFPVSELGPMASDNLCRYYAAMMVAAYH